MANSGTGSEPNERRIRDMMGLVKFCLESTAKEDTTSESCPVAAMDPDRRAWLENAMKSMTVDVTKVLLENLALIKESVVTLETTSKLEEADVQKTCSAMEALADLCEDLDFAVDFAKLDGFSIFKPLVNSSYEELKAKACELIVALAQNNPLCQDMAVSTGLLKRLISLVDSTTNQIKARSYALYAISSIIRSSSKGMTVFEEELDGLPVLLRLIECRHHGAEPLASGQVPQSETPEHWFRKLRIRSIFLFRTLCNEGEKTAQYFFDRQAIKIFEQHLNQLEDLQIREHLLQALVAFLQSLKPSQREECIKLVPNLTKIVASIKSLCPATSDDDDEDFDYTDTLSACQDLTELLIKK